MFAYCWAWCLFAQSMLFWRESTLADVLKKYHYPNWLIFQSEFYSKITFLNLLTYCYYLLPVFPPAYTAQIFHFLCHIIALMKFIEHTLANMLFIKTLSLIDFIITINYKWHNLTVLNAMSFQDIGDHRSPQISFIYYLWNAITFLERLWNSILLSSL